MSACAYEVVIEIDGEEHEVDLVVERVGELSGNTSPFERNPFRNR